MAWHFAMGDSPTWVTLLFTHMGNITNLLYAQRISDVVMLRQAAMLLQLRSELLREMGATLATSLEAEEAKDRKRERGRKGTRTITIILPRLMLISLDVGNCPKAELPREKFCYR